MSVVEKLMIAKKYLVTILSIPLGPRDVRTASPTAVQNEDSVRLCHQMWFGRIAGDFEHLIQDYIEKVPGQHYIPLAATMLLMRTSVGLSLSLKDLGFTAEAGFRSAIVVIDERLKWRDFLPVRVSFRNPVILVALSQLKSLTANL
jgi:hypothetical protein